MNRPENNQAVLYRRFVFVHCLDEGVEVHGSLSVKVVLPTDRPELLDMVPVLPEQLASTILASLNSERMLVSR